MRQLLIGLIRFYQKLIAPFLYGSCRFIPSCSQYCLMAIERFGVFKGIFLGLKRLSKCHLGYSGEWFDMVPPNRTEKQNER